MLQIFVYLNLCYKMRALGYPPGWMLEVQKNEAPVLAMFGKDGNGRLYINIVHLINTE